jgi:hypothetical protein
MGFLQEQLSQEPSLSSLELAARVRQRSSFRCIRAASSAHWFDRKKNGCDQPRRDA